MRDVLRKVIKDLEPDLVHVMHIINHTAVFVSDVEGMTEFIDEGKSGFSFEINNKLQLRQIIEDVIDNPEILANMRNNTRYDKDSRKMTMEIIEVYKELLQEE